MRYQFWIDRGGTFTDCVMYDRDTGCREVTKVLSSDTAPLVGIRKLLGLAHDAAIPACDVRMGTTVATNALLERKGARTTLLISRGFEDTLTIGDQTRPDLFALNIEKPQVLYSRVIGISARLAPDGAVLETPSDDELARLASQLAKDPPESLALVVLHSYARPEFEQQLLARLLSHFAENQTRPSCFLSAELCPEQGLLARTSTTVLGAYVGPLLKNYLKELKTALPGSRLRLMQSAGGLTSPAHFFGTQALLSGPAGGVIAAENIAQKLHCPRLVTLDMGGTSTDVTLVVGGAELSTEKTIDGIQLRTPLLNIHTVAAGGGSVCRFDGYRLTVGPHSVGATPGPLCYPRSHSAILSLDTALGVAGEAVAIDEEALGVAGEAVAVDEQAVAITDVNVVLGRVVDTYFPFRLNPERSRLGLSREAAAMAKQLGTKPLTAEEIAIRFAGLVTTQMAEAIRTVTLSRGISPKDTDLLIFGGAAGQHACAVARYLGIQKVVCHRLSGVLSAYGIGKADLLWHGERDAGRLILSEENLPHFASLCEALVDQSLAHFAQEEGVEKKTDLHISPSLHLRYVGTETILDVPFSDLDKMRLAFEKEHELRFGFSRPSAAVEVTTCRVIVRLKNQTSVVEPVKQEAEHSLSGPETTRVYLDDQGWSDIPLVHLKSLKDGSQIQGPLLLLDATSTYFVDTGFSVSLQGELVILVDETGGQKTQLVSDETAQVPLFSLRFSAIATQMGEALRRSASSTNIRDRLDYSCAIFDPQGHLVANAPHIPVHLGAMSETVRAVLRLHPRMQPGDSYVSNDPALGGSHLPDITVVTPVFDASGTLVCLSASRGHHADIGGITPGSMPADSRTLLDEGIQISACALVRAGEFQESALRSLLTKSPYPARKPEENLADLRAQLAANLLGQRLLLELLEESTRETFEHGMDLVRSLSAKWTRDTIAQLPDGERIFSDQLDTGERICLKVTISGSSMVLDFTGTSPETDNNLNAPYAVTLACVLYVLRTLIDQPLPLSDGCLEPITLIVPSRSLLNPSAGRAVAAGNVETSQRVVDVLLGALGLAAASQGTMNNLSFGNANFGYYETIAGGAGAGPGFSGASAVHTHMTNTRITDPEILESRFPVRLLSYRVRPDSGGLGRYSGGDGVIRELEALEPLDFSIISQRRTTRPFGLSGGAAGASGRNSLDGVLLPGSTKGTLLPGCRLLIETPGGGGYGTVDVSDQTKS